MEPSRLPARGEVYWVELGPTVGAEIRKTRPCLIASSDLVNKSRKTVVVLPVSNGQLQAFPLHVVLSSSDEGSHVILDQVRAVDKTRLGDFAGTVSRADLAQVSLALRTILALN